MPEKGKFPLSSCATPTPLWSYPAVPRRPTLPFLCAPFCTLVTLFFEAQALSLFAQLTSPRLSKLMYQTTHPWEYIPSRCVPLRGVFAVCFWARFCLFSAADVPTGGAESVDSKFGSREIDSVTPVTGPQFTMSVFLVFHCLSQTLQPLFYTVLVSCVLRMSMEPRSSCPLCGSS